MLFFLPKFFVEKQQNDQRNAAAANEAIRHIENRKVHKIQVDHIHHIAQADTVDHIAKAAGKHRHDAPPLNGAKTHSFLGKFPNNEGGENGKDQSKEPLLTLEA